MTTKRNSGWNTFGIALALIVLAFLAWASFSIYQHKSGERQRVMEYQAETARIIGR